MRRDSFLGQVLTAVARVPSAADPIRDVATDTRMIRPASQGRAVYYRFAQREPGALLQASQLVTALARTTPAFTPGSAPPLDTRLSAPRQPGPAADMPHASAHAGSTDDILEFGPRAPSIPKHRSYRQALTVAVAAFAIPVILASIILIKTAIHASPGPVGTPLSPAQSASPGHSPIPNPSPILNPNPSPLPSLTSSYTTLRKMIPSDVESGNCQNVNATLGATAQIQCQQIPNLAQLQTTQQQVRQLQQQVERAMSAEINAYEAWQCELNGDGVGCAGASNQPGAGPLSRTKQAIYEQDLTTYNSLNAQLQTAEQNEKSLQQNLANYRKAAREQAGNIVYYLYANSRALESGFNDFRIANNFQGSNACPANFANFASECESNFVNSSPNITGLVAEHLDADNDPIIVTTDDRQFVMAALIGTNDNSLLAYWRQMQWIVTDG